ncbi:MAG: PDZ domain-containing protein, partial [Moorea sp. SIO4G2]|nr:PDZ domain-containing protein [Moorena sp. SIO4G2]
MGIGFAIPINKVKEISNKLAQGQKVVHPYIGVRMTTLTPELARENNNDPNSVFLLPEVNGVLVVQVMPDTPAADAGMRRGDIIVQIDGRPVTNATQLQRLVENSGVNKVLEIKVRRGKQTTSVFVRTDALKNPT